MYITIVFILTGLRRRCIINALGYVEESVKVCIIFHNMVGWASVCAVTWRSPCARRLFLHSFSIQAVCVHRNSRLERTPELVTALWWQTATSLLFQYQYCLELLACLFLKYYKAEQDKKNSTYVYWRKGQKGVLCAVQSCHQEALTFHSPTVFTHACQYSRIYCLWT